MKQYIQFDAKKGYPAGKNIFYECLKCGDNISSISEDSLGCQCRNIFVDVDAARVSVKDDSMIKICSV